MVGTRGTKGNWKCRLGPYDRELGILVGRTCIYSAVTGISWRFSVV